MFYLKFTMSAPKLDLMHGDMEAFNCGLFPAWKSHPYNVTPPRPAFREQCEGD
jgi:hypothetical protein